MTLEPIPAFILIKVGKKHSGNHSLRSGQLARAAGVSTDTLRHYERKGLLESRRSPNGYREYSPQAVDRVKLIRNALAIGFGLDDLAGILKMRDAGGAPCKEVRALAAAKLDELEAFLREAIMMRNELRRLLGDWDLRLASLDPGEPARLLESLSKANLLGGRTRLKIHLQTQKRNHHKEKS